MTLKIKSQEDEKRQLAVTIEVPEMRVKKEMKAIARKYGKDANVPGFRKGRAPYHIIAKLVGEEQLRQETISEMIEDVFKEAMKELDVEPYGQVDAEDISFDEPVTFKLTVPLEPVIQLGDYRAMRKTFEPVAVTDEAVDEQIQLFLKSHAELTEVDRPAALGDMVSVTGKGYLGDDEEDIIFNEDGEDGFEFLIEADKPFYAGVSIEEALIGATAGAELNFTLNFPEDDESVPNDLVGKAATFALNTLSVKEHQLPELTDEFVQGTEGELETVEALRELITENLEKEATNQFKQDVFQSGIEEMVENVEEMLYPPASVAAEVTRMIEDMKQRVTRSGMDWDTWLAGSEQTVEDLEDTYEDAAVDQVERSLVMQQFVQLENLAVTYEEMTAAVDERVAEYSDEENPEMYEMMKNFWLQSGSEMIAQELIYDKVHHRLLAIYAGEAPDLTADDDDADESEANVADKDNESEPAAVE